MPADVGCGVGGGGSGTLTVPSLNWQVTGSRDGVGRAGLGGSVAVASGVGPVVGKGGGGAAVAVGADGVGGCGVGTTVHSASPTSATSVGCARLGAAFGPHASPSATHTTSPTRPMRRIPRPSC